MSELFTENQIRDLITRYEELREELLGEEQIWVSADEQYDFMVKGLGHFLAEMPQYDEDVQ